MLLNPLKKIFLFWTGNNEMSSARIGCLQSIKEESDTKVGNIANLAHSKRIMLLETARSMRHITIFHTCIKPTIQGGILCIIIVEVFRYKTR